MSQDNRGRDIKITEDLRDKIQLVFLTEGLIDPESNLMKSLTSHTDFLRDSSHGKVYISVRRYIG